MHVAGVGDFRECENHWEGYPEALGGALLSIEAAVVSHGHQQRCGYVCSNWASIVARCRAYIEAERSTYGLEADRFDEPAVFVSTADDWSVYFDTGHESDAVVAVEFRGNDPFQLVIGD
jgi:hypothetical protein